jgi:type VII secretion protein EccE
MALGIELGGLIGWSIAGYPGAGLGIVLGLLLLVVRWYGLPAFAWAGIYLRHRTEFTLVEALTVVNDRCGGGVRYQDGFAAVAVQILGKARTPSRLAGAMAPQTEDTIELCELYGLMRQSLGLKIASIDVIALGARRFPVGDYPRVYDTLIGAPPYAGQRDTWMVIRLEMFGNSSALQRRVSVGTAAVATAQRIAARLQFMGIRARVATVGDMNELEHRLGRTDLDDGQRSWRCVRAAMPATHAGFLSTYGYRPAEITSGTLDRAWSLRVDDLVQRVTLYPDRTISATITVRTSQPLLMPPSVVLHSLPGEQAQAIAGHLCGPPQRLRNVRRRTAPSSLVHSIGASGVLLGRNPQGERVLLPFSDLMDFARIEIAADDAITKRLLIRSVATGLRITVHTTNPGRWESIKMSNLWITDQSKPVTGTTVSVIDGSVSCAPRPNTVVSVSAAETSPTAPADITITQTGPRTIRVLTPSGTEHVEVDMFRAENRYVGDRPPSVDATTTRFADR